MQPMGRPLRLQCGADKGQLIPVNRAAMFSLIRAQALGKKTSSTCQHDVLAQSVTCTQRLLLPVPANGDSVGGDIDWLQNSTNGYST